MANLTKSKGELQDWYELEDGTTKETNILDSGESLDSSLNAFLSLVAASSNNKTISDNSIYCHVYIDVDGTDEGWRFWCEYVMDGGVHTPRQVDVLCSSPTTEVSLSNSDDISVGDRVLLRDNTTANSELGTVVDNDTGNDDLTMMDGITNDKSSGDYVDNMVNEWLCWIPPTIQRAKAIFFNTDGDAHVHIRTDYTIITAMA